MLDESIQASIRARLGSAPFASWFGIELASMDQGEAELHLRLRDEHLNPGGIAHGGVAAALLDSAIGLALRTTLPDGATHATLQLQVTYLRPVSAGTLIARGRAVHAGRRMEYGEGSLSDQDGTLLARGTASFMVLSGADGGPTSPPASDGDQGV